MSAAERRMDVRGFVVALLSEQDGSVNLDGERLLSDRRLTSLQFLRLLLFVEEKIACAIDEADLTNTNFDSIDAIEALASRYSSQGQPRT